MRGGMKERALPVLAHVGISVKIRYAGAGCLNSHCV